MKYNIFLKCMACNKESNKKECDEEKVNHILHVGSMALQFPKHMVCPNCRSFLKIRMMKEEIK